MDSMQDKLKETFRGKLVLITGGLGFIGSSLAWGAAACGARIRILDAKLDPYGWNEANLKGMATAPEVLVGDTRDQAAVAAALRGADYVFECAGQISHTLSMQNPLLDADINLKGALTVLEGIRQVAPQARVVYAASRGLVGRMQQTPVTEAHPTEPVDVNGINKLAAEKQHLLYHRVHGVRTTSLRIANTYGPRGQMRHGDYGIVNWFTRLALEGKEIAIYGEGLQTRDYNYVDDVVTAFLLAAVTPAAEGEVFMLGSGIETPFIRVLEMIREETGLQIPIRHMPWDQGRKAIEIGNYAAAIEKARKVLGWEPKVTLPEGIRRMVEFYRAHRQDYF
jgi:nucleoside-diphosphate-sugar epimerase